MKNYLKYFVISILIVIAASIVSAQNNKRNDLKITANALNPKAILCEPLLVDIELINDSESPFNLYGCIWYNRYVIVNKEKYEVDNPVKVECMAPDHPSKIMMPGEKMTKQADLLDYPPFWKAGEYEVQYVIEINNQEYASKPFIMNIADPAGMNMEAFEARQRNDLQSKNSDCTIYKRGTEKDWMHACNPCDFKLSNWEMITKYPKSIYAAWDMIHTSIIFPTMRDPVKIAEGVQKGTYPTYVSIPIADSKEQWKRLNTKEAAQWMKEQGNEILRLYPNFAYAEKIKASIAISELILGNESEGIAILKKLAQNPQTKEAEWSKKFLHEWFQKKSIR